MKHHAPWRHASETRVICCVLTLSMILLFTAGCSTLLSVNTTAKRFIRNVRSPDGDLKKKVGIARFENKTTMLHQALELRYINYLVENLNASCPNIILVKPDDADVPDFLITLPKQESGWVNTLELAEAGRQTGLNAIVTGALTTIEKKQEERGFWWFKDIHYFFEVHLSVNVFDTLTGAKLLDESFAHEMEIDETEFTGSNTSSDVVTSIINEAFQKIAAGMGEQVCTQVVLQQWKGYITSVREDNMVIASGKNVGIAPGDIFEVYDSSEIFTGSAGQRFFIPGLKTGEIQVTKVFAESAEAVRISGETITEGSSIRPKD